MKLFQSILKCLLGMALLCFILPTQAQNINTTLAQDINHVFNPLEKNRIPHSILLDYGFDLIDVKAFNGVLSSTNYVSTKRYNQIYTTLVSAVTAHNISGIASPTQELNEWKSLQAQANETAKTTNKASVVLSGLLYNYSTFNPNALSNNKIQVVNGQYDDKYINGVWQNPYDEKLAFAMAAPVLYINKAEVEATLPTALWHSNTTVTQIDINFGDGNGYKSLLNNAVASTTYTNTGEHTWTYRIQLNGQYKYCRQKVIVNEAATNTQARNPTCGALDIEQITATKAYQGVFGSATLQIAYGSDDCELRNPLIVAEGLDTGLLAQAGSIGDLDIISFFDAVDNSNSIDLRNLITNNTAIDYDVVYVNWDNGTDFIQRNAYVLEAVIDWVNANKVGNAQNVVLGQSMGGLIARYALRDMENNNEDHDTSLYISHDAPHQGAHIPLGVLFAARHIANEFLELPFLSSISVPVEDVGELGLAIIDDLLDAPAVNQLLINNVDTNVNRTNIAHNNWQIELRNMGYPQFTRNISLSNASHCALPQGLRSNETLLDISGSGNTTILTDIVFFVLGAGALIGDYFDDTATFLLGFLPGSSEIDIEFKAKAFPSSGTAQIYKGRLTYTKNLAWLIPITRTIFNVTKNSLSTDKFKDNFPGGVNPSNEALNASGAESNFLFGYGYNLNLNLNLNFISATSALDVGSGNATLSNSDYFRKYTSENPPTGSLAIPFDNFTTSFNNTDNNEPHISFNRRNGDWLALELNNIANDEDLFNCTYVCSDAKIFGSNQICHNTPVIYNINGWPSNANFTWNITSPGGFALTPNGSSVTVTPNGNFTGEAVLTVTASNDCGTTTSTKNLQVGSQRPIYLDENGEEQASFTFCMLNWDGISFATPPGVTQWDWQNPSGNFSMNANNNQAQFFDHTPASGFINVRTLDACGWSAPTFLYINLVDCSGGGGFGNFRMAQNPVSNGNLRVVETQDNNSSSVNSSRNASSSQNRTSENTDVTFELYDFTGLVLTTWTEQHDTVNWDYDFDVSQYEDGHYFIRIIYGDINEMHHIIIDN